MFSGITGYNSIYYGHTDIEAEYDSYLEAHPQPAQTLSQILFREKLPTLTDNVTLTVEPKLQEAAAYALSTVKGVNKDGAIVVLNPKTGAVLAMYSSPSYDPNVLVSTSLAAEKLGYLSYTSPDHEGFFPLRPLATGYSFYPGSTMKVVTSTAVYNLKPLLAGFNYPVQPCQKFTDSNKLLCNDGTTPADSDPCGRHNCDHAGRIVRSGLCGAGSATRRPYLAPAGRTLRHQCTAADRPAEQQRAASRRHHCVHAAAPLGHGPGIQGYSAIGQLTIQDTALQNAMVAAGIANGGVVMTPHLMSSIQDSQGSEVKTYTPTVYKHAASASAAQSVTSLMEGVIINPHGTAAGVGFPSYLCAAVKTGTAQTGLNLNHDWMIGFAPANNPQVAIAVVVPWQYVGSEGATVAGPIMKFMMEQALPQGSVQQPCTVNAPSSP